MSSTLSLYFSLEYLGGAFFIARVFRVWRPHCCCSSRTWYAVPYFDAVPATFHAALHAAFPAKTILREKTPRFLNIHCISRQGLCLDKGTLEPFGRGRRSARGTAGTQEFHPTM